MSLPSKGRVVSSHIFIILLNKWIYPAYKLANAFSPCSTCWHFPADGSAEEEWERWLGTKDRHVWSLSFTAEGHWPARPSHPAGGLAGRGRAWDCRYCCEGQSGGREEVRPAFPLRMNFRILNLFVLLWVGQSVFCVFFPFGIISHTLSTDDLFLNQ